MSFSDDANELNTLLAENPSQVVARLGGMFDVATKDTGGPLVLCGAGPLGRRTLRGLTVAGRRPVAFLDNNPKLWHTSVEGVEVLPPEEAVARYASEAIFVVTIYNHSAVRRQLSGLGCSRVISFASLHWKYAEAFLPYCSLGDLDQIFGQRDEVRAGFELWDDDQSRQYYVSQIRWRLWLDSENLPPPCPAKDTYFPDDLVQPLPDEVFVDCGAFDGDTVREFFRRRGATFKNVIPFEPDPDNFAALSRFAESLEPAVRERVLLKPLAAASHNGVLSFDLHGDMSSSATASGTVQLNCARLDDVLAEHPPTYIKMDIEGGELDALAGAEQTIAAHRPVLAICLYHKQSDLWRIPQTIKEICSDYRLYLRLYAEDCWESICYAVPKERVVS